MKQNKGITLVALIITIIILLILAVVTISAVNEGSLFAHANNVARMYKEESEIENQLIYNLLKKVPYDTTTPPPPSSETLTETYCITMDGDSILANAKIQYNEDKTAATVNAYFTYNNYICGYISLGTFDLEDCTSGSVTLVNNTTVNNVLKVIKSNGNSIGYVKDSEFGYLDYDEEKNKFELIILTKTDDKDFSSYSKAIVMRIINNTGKDLIWWVETTDKLDIKKGTVSVNASEYAVITESEYANKTITEVGFEKAEKVERINNVNCDGIFIYSVSIYGTKALLYNVQDYSNGAYEIVEID